MRLSETVVQPNNPIGAQNRLPEISTTDPRVSTSSIDDVLAAAGLLGLGEDPPMDAVKAALSELASLARGADALDREVLREGAIRALQRAKVSAPARLVDSVLAGSPPATGPERGKGTSLALSDPVPWPDPVDGRELFNELTGVFLRYLSLPDEGATRLALWTLHAHTHAAVIVSPFLALTSATKRCGKTTALTVLGQLVPRALLASNITPAALFRAVDAFRPTLMIDEGDTFLGLREELRGILNGGHTLSSAGVVRTTGDHHEPRMFSTWCPKAIAMIGDLPDTLRDRAIEIRLRRRRSSDMIETLRLDRLTHLEGLRSRCTRWAADHLEQLKHADPLVPEGLNDRAADNWRPLLAISIELGGDCPDKARRAAVDGSRSSLDDGDIRIMLLADLEKLFRESNADRLPSADLVSALGQMEDRPWPEWKGGGSISEAQLAGLLKPFDVRPHQFRFGDKIGRGYSRTALEDVWSRYLPRAQSAPGTPVQPSNGATYQCPGGSTDEGTEQVDSSTLEPTVPVYRSEGGNSPEDVSDEDYEAFERIAIQLESELPITYR